MIDNISIDVSVPALWRCWQLFSRGKRRTNEFLRFLYRLEDNLIELHRDLHSGEYRHGQYRSFTVNESKTREISVASVRDRVVHRLLYDHLVDRFEKTFIFDAWSCRKKKGLHGAIKRSARFVRAHRTGFFWRADIRRFFASVDHSVLRAAIRRRVWDERSLRLIDIVIASHESARGTGRGIPIGNLSSQVFANIYLNELDRFVKHELRIGDYVRYGDDFVIFGTAKALLSEQREAITEFVAKSLRLEIHKQNNALLPCSRGLRWIGHEVFPCGCRVQSRTRTKMARNLGLLNVASYAGMCRMECRRKQVRFQWEVARLLESVDFRHRTVA